MSCAIQDGILGNDQGIRDQDDAVAIALDVTTAAEIPAKISIVTKADGPRNKRKRFTPADGEIIRGNQPVKITRPRGETTQACCCRQRVRASPHRLWGSR